MEFKYLYKEGEKACASEPLKVLLDGHPYGEIRKVEGISGEIDYQHFPEDGEKGGVIFSMVSEVQNSLRLSCPAKADRKPAESDGEEPVNAKLVKELEITKNALKGVQIAFKEVNEKLDRVKILLTATFDLLDLQKDSEDALNLLEEFVAYDNADCDGHGLYDDIQRLIDFI